MTQGGTPIFRELNNSGKETRLFYKDKSFKELGSGGLRHFFVSAFLPSGYPFSVSSDYIQYQFWDTLQAFCSSLSGSLATRAVLKGVGVGDEHATALGATLTWLSRSGAGMLGHIAFAYFKAQDLDCSPKRWRLFADVLNDLSMALEIGASYLPFSFFPLFACFASVFRSIVGVAGGATRTAITQHQARSNNISDVSAKDGSQETLVNLIALILNLALLPLIPEDLFIVLSLFFALSLLHITTNLAGVKCLVFDTFNRERLSDVLRLYFDGQTILSPKEANSRESLLWPKETQHAYKYRIHLGSRAKDHVEHIIDNMEELQSKGFLIIKDSCKVDVILMKGNLNLLEVYFEVFKKLQNQVFSDVSFQDFSKDASSLGWCLDRAHILTEGNRIDFNKSKMS
eukprot:TRINITY_DN11286_c0_g1_i1.p1 TRINITY_DN11286_c0_g1~~TRINITY_DN11286_c0_g1_i1.p1  ORF type:complete len:400 (-),score=58.35 TRINITY_DN11286_c0_g1_i1:72-1271(-)